MDKQLLNTMFDTQMEILNNLYFELKFKLPLKTKADIYLAKELDINRG